MLWCPGIPGAGKTVIASIAFDHLRATFKDQDTAILCIFCNHADRERQTSTESVASLLEQLVRTKGATGEIRAFYQRHQTRNTRQGLAELSKLLHSMVEKTARVFIVIDALDECLDTTRRAFIGQIHKFRSRAHLLVTSRPAVAIADAPEFEFHDAIHLEIHALNADLENYIRARTQQDHQIARYLKQDLALQEEVVTTIVDNARGMFLLVRLHLDSLAKQKNKRDIRNALSSLPKEIDETYNQAMERIRSQDTESVRLAESVLAWILNARRPFSVEELQHALATQPDETKFDEEAIYPEDVIVSVCAGLVIVDRMSHVIRLVHYTTQKYFDCERRAELFPDIELKITKTCISYLLFDDFETEELTHGEEHIEVNDELHSKYPLLEYAGENWGHHARGENEYLAGDMIGRLLQQKLRLFLVCDLIDQSGIRAFGPVPALTVLVYFGLRRYIGSIANFDESSDLTCAIRYRRKELVFFLVERGADWYDTGACSLQAACSFFQLKGSEGMVISLAEKGVTMDLSVDNGEFLFNRVWLKSSDTEGRRLMEALLELGAAFDPQNITYYTPLMCAAIEGDFLSWDIEKLLKSGVPVSEKNELERDPLIYAALARFEAAVRPLLEAGADVHSRDEGGMTALSAACEGGNAHIVKLLLEHGADVSAKDRNSRTPMSIAVESGNAVMIRLLRGEGMDEPDEKPFFPETEAPLHRMWHLIRPGGTVGLPEYKPVEVARPGAFRRGYDKIMPAWVDEFFKIKARKKNSTNVEEQKHEKVDSDGASP